MGGRFLSLLWPRKDWGDDETLLAVRLLTFIVGSETEDDGISSVDGSFSLNADQTSVISIEKSDVSIVPEQWTYWVHEHYV